MTESGDFLNSWSALRARNSLQPGPEIRSRAAPSEKTCSRCEESKPVGEFRRLRASRDGPHRWWDQCQIADARSRNFPVCETGTIVGVQCHAEKGELEFYADKRLRSGRVRLCKSCRKSRRMYRSAESGRTDRDRGEWVTKRERHGFHRCRDCGHSGYVVAGRSRHEDTGEGQSTLTLKHANGVVCGQLSEQQFVRWNPMPQASQGALQARSEGVGVVRRRITSGFARGGRCGKWGRGRLRGAQ